MLQNLNDYNIILASKSPRRQHLLHELGVNFEVKTFEVDEVYPDNLKVTEIPVFLAELKAKPFEQLIDEKTLVITSDTIVCCENEVLGKPADYNDAVRMLQLLSGKAHQVITGVCLFSKQKKKTFITISDVYFKQLTTSEIEYYLSHFQPYDKAGAYGVQEWIGYVAVERIDGSYFNVMGLPLHQLYEELSKF